MTVDVKQHMQEMATELANRPLVVVIIETGLFVVIALTAVIGKIILFYVYILNKSVLFSRLQKTGYRE